MQLRSKGKLLLNADDDDVRFMGDGMTFLDVSLGENDEAINLFVDLCRTGTTFDATVAIVKTELEIKFYNSVKDCYRKKSSLNPKIISCPLPLQDIF